jgi:hypothetical protein
VPDAAKRTFIEKATALDRPWPLEVRVLAVGQTWVWRLAGVPVSGKSPYPLPE